MSDHLGHNLKPEDRYEPRDQGFDFDFPHTPSAAGPGGGYLAPWTKFIKDPAITGQPGENIEDRMSTEAAKYISAHKDRRRIDAGNTKCGGHRCVGVHHGG